MLATRFARRRLETGSQPSTLNPRPYGRYPRIYGLDPAPVYGLDPTLGRMGPVPIRPEGGGCAEEALERV